MAQSGDRCEQAGVYESGCADATRVGLMAGSPFPECRVHGQVTWALLQASSETPSREPGASRRRRSGNDPDWQTGSGRRCRHTGLYESLCADKIRIAVMKGSRFPTCGNHGDVSWILVTGRLSVN